MNLDEALAVRLVLRNLGYPTKDQVSALAEAERVIFEQAEKAIERHKRDSAPSG